MFENDQNIRKNHKINHKCHEKLGLGIDIVESSIVVLFIGLVSLFNGISTLCRLFNAEAILLEEQ